MTVSCIAAGPYIGPRTRLGLARKPPTTAAPVRMLAPMADYETLLVRKDDGVAWVSLNRPEVRNAINQQMQDELRSGVDQLSVRRRRSMRRAHRRGDGLLHGHRPSRGGVGREQRVDGGRRLPGLPDAWMYDDPGRDVGPKSRDLWKPVIAAVKGMACGGAFYLLGEVEFIIASDDAVFFDPHVTYGMTAAFEPIQMLSKMPFQEIMRLSLLGAHERMSADACAPDRARHRGRARRRAARAGRVGGPGHRRLLRRS